MKQPNQAKARGFADFLPFFAFLCLIMTGLTSCKGIPSAKPYLTDDRDTGWLNDIAYLEKTLPKVHKNLYFTVSESEFLERLEELKGKIPEYSDEQMTVALSVIVAGMGDSHTGSNVGSKYQYPLELRWFAEGIYVMGTSREYQELLDARIISMNGKGMEKVTETLRPILAGANDSWFKTQIVYYLPIPGVLRYFGVDQREKSESNPEEIDLKAELRDGSIREVRMRAISYEEFTPAQRQEGPDPLYLSRPDENYWYEYFEDEKIIYMNYSRCRENQEKSFKKFSKEFWDFTRNHDCEKLVVDVRKNRGGSSPILEPFIKTVKESSFNKEGKLYVIIGKDTFSSAVLNAVRFKKETHAVFVGEATGGEPNHFGEVKNFKLPNSGITVRYSTKHFHWLDEDTDTLNPDAIVEDTFADYRDGADPVLAWIIRQE